MRLDELIKRKGFTDCEFSKESKVSPATISQIKSGKRKEIRFSTAKKIADALEITTEELYKYLGGEEDASKN